MHRKWIAAVVAIIVILGMLIEIPLVGRITADAAVRRIPAISCVSMAFINSEEPRAFLGALFTSPRARAFACPIPDDDVFPKTAVTLVEIFGFLQANRQVSARVCSLRPGVGPLPVPVETCTSPKIHSQPGGFVLAFQDEELVPAWGTEHAGDLGIIEIIFNIGDFVSSLTGIYVFFRD